MPWGQIAGAVIGGVMANKAAKKAAGAQRYAADKSAQGYDDARPYITQMYQEGRDYLNDALDQGAYTGQTYAGLNPTQMQGVEYLRNFGQGLMPAASNFMDTAGHRRCTIQREPASLALSGTHRAFSLMDILYSLPHR